MGRDILSFQDKKVRNNHKELYDEDGLGMYVKWSSPPLPPSINIFLLVNRLLVIKSEF